MREKKRWLFFSLIILLSSFSLCRIYATPQSSIQVSPLLREYTLFPGETAKDLLVFFNPSSVPQEVQIKVYDFLPADERGGLKFFQDAGWQFSASRWILFSPKSFLLQPKEERTLPVSIVVPENAEPGTHFAAIFGEAVSSQKQEGKENKVQVKVHVGAGTLLLINVPDVEKKRESYSGHIVSFEIHGLKQIKSGFKQIPIGLVRNRPLIFIVRFKNTGNFAQKPEGEIEVFDFLGRKISLLKLKKQRVLPGAIIQFKVSWKPKFLFGSYLAVLRFHYGKENNLLVERDLKFTAFSPLLIGLLMGAILLTLGIFWYQRRKRKEKRT